MPIGDLVTMVILALITGLGVAPIRRPRALRSTEFPRRRGGQRATVPRRLPGGRVDVAGCCRGRPRLAGRMVRVRIRSRGDRQPRGHRAPTARDAHHAGSCAARRSRHGDRSRSAPPPPVGSHPLRAVLLRRRDVERVANIAYSDAGAQNRLDLYRNRSRLSRGPTLIHLHGGHFQIGRKNREARPLFYRLASRGWVCISANYRLGPGRTSPIT